MSNELVSHCRGFRRACHRERRRVRAVPWPGPRHHQAIDGNTLSVKSREGQDLKIVPDNIPIVMAVDGDRSLLVAGQYAYIAVATDADGKMTATRVQITKDGVKPPQ
ncbi:MAG TPA: hypothetical protein VEN78_41610 [Bradyrhizobium sp.]|nr:hypothetical protein [Bradyrhizobium sp.]